MRSISGGYKSQPLDLDNDGVDEIKLAATKANVKNTLGTLANKLNKDDHLFIFVIDHGGTDDYNTNSYICLWNYESLYDYELATMLEPFTSKFVNVNVVLGQCFSGGFNDNLKRSVVSLHQLQQAANRLGLALIFLMMNLFISGRVL